MIPSRAEEMIWRGTSLKCPYKQQWKIWCSSDHDTYRDVGVYYNTCRMGPGESYCLCCQKGPLKGFVGKQWKTPWSSTHQKMACTCISCIIPADFVQLMDSDFRFALPDPESVGRKSTSNPGLGVFSWHPDYVSIYHNHLKRRNPHAIRTEHT